MNSSFKSDIKIKSSEQLLNMVSNYKSWNDDQLKLILEEIENRDLINDETEEIKALLYKDLDVEEFDLENPHDAFERDLSIIRKVEENDKKIEQFQTPALVIMLFLAGLFFTLLFNLISKLGIQNEFADRSFEIFNEYQAYIIVLFFITVGLFIVRKYIFSLFVSTFILVAFFMLLSI